MLYDRLLQHRHHWTSEQLLGEDPEVVEDLRFALYGDLLADMATADLEGAASDLDTNEALMNAKNDAMRLNIQRGQLATLRMRIRSQFLPRAKARLAMLLRLDDVDRKLLDDAKKAEEAQAVSHR